MSADDNDRAKNQPAHVEGQENPDLDDEDDELLDRICDEDGAEDARQEEIADFVDGLSRDEREQVLDELLEDD